MTSLSMFSLAGKVAVVAGGAGGIGSAIALGLAQAGARVVVAGLRLEDCEQVASTINAAGGKANACELDITRETAVEEVFTSTVRHFGSVDILVNSAGTVLRAPAIDLPLDAWDKVIAVNMTGVFLCCRAAARHMMAGNGGSIINVASIMGLSGGGLYPNISYQSSKGAVVNMTRSLALEWAKDNIRVNAIAPTWVRTEFIRGILDNVELTSRVEAMIPLGRLAEAEDMVGAAVYLASAASAMVTGHILAVDGGFLAQ